MKEKLALIIKENPWIPVNTLVPLKEKQNKKGPIGVVYQNKDYFFQERFLILIDKDKAPSEFAQHQFKEFLTLVNSVKNAYYNLVQDGEDFSFPEMIEKVTEKHVKRMSDELENKMFEK